MTRYNGNIANLLQGASQQARRDRRPEQLTSQENCYSSVTRGLGRRPGSERLASGLNIPNFVSAAKHAYDRGDGVERYTMIVSDTGLVIIDMITGETEPVLVQDVSYLADFSGEDKDPSEYLKFYTIADTTFVVNTTKTVESMTPSDSVKWQAIIHCVKANYGYTYQVVIDGTVEATYDTPSTVTVSSTIADKTSYVQSSEIITQLYGGLAAWAAGESGISIEQGIDEIVITSTVEANYDITVHDDNGNNDLKLITFKSSDYDALPVRCKPGFKTKITGKDGDSENDYYVEFVADNEDPSLVETPDVENTYSAPFSELRDFTSGDNREYEEDSAENTVLPTGTNRIEAQVNIKGTVGEDEYNSSEGRYEVPEPNDNSYGMDIEIRLDCEYAGASGVFEQGTPLKFFGVQGDDFDVVLTHDAGEDTITKMRYYTKMSNCEGDDSRFEGDHNGELILTLDDYTTIIKGVSGDDITQGKWEECIGFNVDTQLDPTTMPYKIVSGTEGFTIGQNEWVDREAGDDDSNPLPSFVGHSIETILSFGERLVFLSEENCATSVTYDQYNLFADSVIQESESDPIDVSSSDNQVTNLKHALVFDASLMIFSDKAQFLHPSDRKFTPNTFGLASKSRYSMATLTTPVASATSVFFSYRFGEFTGVREYKIDGLTGITSADSITHHVPEYLPGSCIQLASSTDYDILLARLDGDTDGLYVFQWFDQDNDRKQAAWHRWTMPFDIEYMTIIKDSLYLWYVEDSGTISVSVIDLSAQDTSGLEFNLCLDAYEEIESTEVGLYWTFDVDLADYSADSYDELKVIAGNNSGQEGSAVTWSEDSDTISVLKSALPDASGTPSFFVGKKYESEVQLTNPYVRNSSGSPMTHARTQLKHMIVNVDNTGYLNIDVEKVYAPTFTVTYSSMVLDSGYELNAAAPSSEANIRVPIRSDAKTCSLKLNSDSHYPFNVLDIDWSCEYTEVGRRTV